MTHIDTLKERVFPLLKGVARPGRYVGGELNIVRKEPGSESISVCIAFPDIYDIGQSYIGYHILYNVLNRTSGVRCERAFAPWPDMEEAMRTEDIPLWSLENFLPVSSFDVVGFTLQYELHYTTVLNMLDLAGIPLRADERGGDDPVILGGGTCVMNPEPMADYFDAFLLGDGEEGFPEMLEVLRDAKTEGCSRGEKLRRLSELEGVYVPSFYRVDRDDKGFVAVEPTRDDVPFPVHARIVEELKPEYLPDKPLVPLCEVVHDRLAVEIMRGCTHGCRFCSAGMTYRPQRVRKVNEVVDIVTRGIKASGWDEVSLVSLSSTDFPGLQRAIERIGRNLSGKSVSISLSSLRADKFSLEMAGATSGGRKTNLTFAVEAGTQRLRDVINKNLTEEQLFETITTAFEQGFSGIKLYFMIGLPTETDEDVVAIAELLSRLGRLVRKYKGRRINVTVSPFAPKPHTPFQWERQNSADDISRKLDLINAHLRSRSINIRTPDPVPPLIESLLARGGRDMGAVVHDAWRNGCRLDGWSECFDRRAWEEAFETAGIDLLTGGGESEPGAPLPWGHLHFGVDERYLLEERLKAAEGIVTPDCRKKCHNCGPYAAFCNAAKKARAEEEEEQTPSGSASDSRFGRRRKPGKNIREQVGLQGTHLRVRYGKSGTSRYTGHLDMVRLFDRALRRAGIPVAFSQGFHPHPKLSFGYPLPLGMMSRAEYVDIKLETPFPSFDTALRKAMPEGIELIGIATLTEKVRSLTKIVSASDYHVACDMDARLEDAVGDILARESIPVVRNTKKGDKTIDIRPGIESIGIDGDGGGLLMTLSLDSERPVRPGEVLDLLFPESKPTDVTRMEQYTIFNGERRTPMEILW